MNPQRKLPITEAEMNRQLALDWGWITSVARGLTWHWAGDLDDLRQEGLIAAWESYKVGIWPSKDWVRKAMLRWIREQEETASPGGFNVVPFNDEVLAERSIKRQTSEDDALEDEEDWRVALMENPEAIRSYLKTISPESYGGWGDDGAAASLDYRKASGVNWEQLPPAYIGGGEKDGREAAAQPAPEGVQEEDRERGDSSLREDGVGPADAGLREHGESAGGEE